MVNCFNDVLFNDYDTGPWGSDSFSFLQDLYKSLFFFYFILM